MGVTDNMTAINIGTQLGTQHLFTLEGMLYEFTGPGSMQLRSNWQQVWSDFVPTAKEVSCRVGMGLLLTHFASLTHSHTYTHSCSLTRASSDSSWVMS